MSPIDNISASLAKERAETGKFIAASLDRASTACLAIGVFTPLATGLSKSGESMSQEAGAIARGLARSLPSDLENYWKSVVVLALWLVIAIVLHRVALSVLRRSV